MVLRLRSTSVMGLLLALILSLASVGMVAQPAQAADDATAALITSTSPTMNRPAAGGCGASGTMSNYAVVKFTTNGVGAMSMRLTVTTSGPVTAMLYQGVFMPEMPNINCYIRPWSQATERAKTTTTGYDNSTLPQFPEQTWYLVLASDNPGDGIDADVKVNTSLGAVDVDNTLGIATPALPDATVGQPYWARIAPAGGVFPLNYSAEALPAGLSISAAGVISGTPTAVGLATAAVAVTDAQSQEGSKNLSLLVKAPTLRLAPATLPDMRALDPASATLAATGGTAPYSYSISSGVLPQGLALSTAGVLSGIPATGGPYAFTVRAQDSSTGTGAPFARDQSYAGTVAAAQLPTIEPAQLPAAQAGQVYAQQLSAGDGVAPYTFGVASGSLPAGLTLSPSGLLAGTPTASGDFPLTFKVTDSRGREGQRPYLFTVTAPVLVAGPAALPAAAAYDPYSAALSASGGVAPYTFAVTGGALPAGLDLTSSGVLSGRPTSHGTFTFAVTVIDSSTGTGPARAVKSFTLEVAAPVPPGISPAALPAGTAGVPYSVQLSGTDGNNPYAFSLTAGTLPDGLGLDADGLLSGTPTVAGSFPLKVTVTDGRGLGTMAEFTLEVAAPVIRLLPETLPPAEVGSSYLAAATASGGTAPYSFAVTSGALPGGLTLNPAGSISGTPASPGSSSFTLTVTDKFGFTAVRNYTLASKAAPLVLQPAALPTPTAGEFYSVQLTTSGGYGTFSYAVTAGALPEGLSLDSNTGLLAGTPTRVGSHDFSISSTDTATTGAGTVSTGRSYTLVVPSASLKLQGSLRQGQVGSNYVGALSATGGTGPYTFALQTGSTLPAGLALAGSGLVTGTPAAAGDYTLAVTLQDAYGSTSQATAALVIAPLVTVGPETLPDAQSGVDYSQQLTADGGTGPYTFTVSSGTLPAGLTLDADGLLAGTPAIHGTSAFAVTATDAGNFTGAASYTLDVAAAALALGPDTLPVPTAASPYSAQLTVSGGVGPFGFELAAGELPPGLTLNAATGLISGIPTAVGASAFTVATVDQGAVATVSTFRAAPTASAGRSYTLNVESAELLPVAELPGGTAGAGYAVQLQVSGGVGPYIFEAVPGTTLPAGLVLERGGRITGTPPTAGTWTFAVLVTDTQGSTVTADFTLAIAPAAAPATPPSDPPAEVAPDASGHGLAATGTAGAGWLLAAGGIAVVGGLVALLVVRRRRN